MAYSKFRNGFEVQTPSAIDKRICLSKDEMRTIGTETPQYLVPDTYFCICTDDGKLYLFDSKNSVDPQLGQYRPIVDFNTEVQKIITVDASSDPSSNHLLEL